MKRRFFIFIIFLWGIWSCGDKNEETKDILDVVLTEKTFEASGGKVEISVKSTTGWQVSDIPSWIELKPKQGTPDDKKTEMEVKENKDSRPRTADIKFSAGNATPVILKIEQKGLIELTLSPKNLEFDYSGGKKTVEIRATSAWSVEGMNEWCKISKEAGEAGEEILEIETLPNNEEKERKVTLTFKMGDRTQSFDIIQKEESLEEILKRERKVLVKFFNETDGKNWSSSYGWGDKNIPVSEWAHLNTDADGRVTSLNFKEVYGLKGKLIPELKEFKRLKKIHIGLGDFRNSSIPKELGELKNLEELVLKQCLLEGEIPEEIFKLEKLKILNLGVNNLSGEIPANLKDCKNLEYLSLERNKLRGKPEISGLVNLKELYLSFNGFEGKIDFITSLTSLCIIHIYNNKFSGEIPTGIGELKNIEILQLSDNNLTGSLPKECVKPSKMRYLDVSMNKLNGRIPDEILNWEVPYTIKDENGNIIEEGKKPYEWTNLYEWKKICEQQAGFGFENAPKKPVK